MIYLLKYLSVVDTTRAKRVVVSGKKVDGNLWKLIEYGNNLLDLLLADHVVLEHITAQQDKVSVPLFGGSQNIAR
jgi:hypothetical protein